MMALMHVVLNVVAALSAFTTAVDGSSILVVPWCPGYNSRARNMLHLCDQLVDAGHKVSVLLPSFEKNRVKNDKVWIRCTQVALFITP